MKDALVALNQDIRMRDALATQNIDWHFTPPMTPHMGGVWERLVRSVKRALSSTLKERAPREETLLTALAEAEFTVNNRPLTHISMDPRDDGPLTPNHFLLGSAGRRPSCPFMTKTKKKSAFAANGESASSLQTCSGDAGCASTSPAWPPDKSGTVQLRPSRRMTWWSSWTHHYPETAGHAAAYSKPYPPLTDRSELPESRHSPVYTHDRQSSSPSSCPP